MSEQERPVHGPFGRFDVTTERMPDGRTIRYYAWPADGDREAHGRSASADAADAEEEPRDE